jgi:hypothetical protein
MKPHKHAETIKAWVDGNEVEYLNSYNKWQSVLSLCTFSDRAECHFRVKPPREFPKTSLSAEQVSEVYAKAFGDNIRADLFNQRKKAAILAVADAAIKQYILDTEDKS